MTGAADLDTPDDLLRTAEQHASMRVPIATRSEPVSALLNRLRGQQFDSASVVAVCDGERLVGLVAIERLLAAPAESVVETVMDTTPPTVSPATHQEHVAWQAVQRGEPGIAVIDDSGSFRGLISAQSLLGVLLEEHDEDMARLGGFLGTASAARSASTERVGRRLLHRLPWLLVGLVGALLAAVIVGAFGEQLEETVLIAYFVPGVVYIAAAVGMQTETLAIRGLSVGVGIQQVAVREVVTGALLGLSLACLAFPLIWAGWGNLEVAAAVALAMFAASSIATGVALLLPWTLHRLGKDPAFGSGPIATVIQDLLTVSVYFLTATAIAS
jgi:magnesium transporter